MENLYFIVVMGLAFWFLIIRPQQARQRKHREMVDALKVGDEILTIGGLFGRVIDVAERIRVRLYDGTEVELAPMAIGQVVTAEVFSDDEDGDEVSIDTMNEDAESGYDEDGPESAKTSSE